MEVVHTDVDFRTAGHAAGELLAEKKSRMLAESFGPFDGIVIGKSEKIHAAMFESLENLKRVAIAFATEFSEHWSGAGARVVGVNVEIAFHDFHSKFTRLLTGENCANILKIQALNLFDTCYGLLTYV
jgi:hypothetical protein